MPLKNISFSRKCKLMKPFEGLFGNTCELRMIQYLLSLEGLEFNLTELAEEVGVSRPSATKAVKRFVEWGLVNARNEKNITYYSLNRKSPIVETILQLDNLLIEKILGEETLYEIHDYLETKKQLVERNTVMIYYEIEPSASNWLNNSQNVFKKSNLWQEKGSFKHHKFYSDTEEKSTFKLSKLVVAT